jgi:hypothetical protein
MALFDEYVHESVKISPCVFAESRAPGAPEWPAGRPALSRRGVCLPVREADIIPDG